MSKDIKYNSNELLYMFTEFDQIKIDKKQKSSKHRNELFIKINNLLKNANLSSKYIKELEELTLLTKENKLFAKTNQSNKMQKMLDIIKNITTSRHFIEYIADNLKNDQIVNYIKLLNAENTLNEDNYNQLDQDSAAVIRDSFNRFRSKNLTLLKFLDKIKVKKENIEIDTKHPSKKNTTLQNIEIVAPKINGAFAAATMPQVLNTIEDATSQTLSKENTPISKNNNPKWFDAWQNEEEVEFKYDSQEYKNLKSHTKDNSILEEEVKSITPKIIHIKHNKNTEEKYATEENKKKYKIEKKNVNHLIIQENDNILKIFKRLENLHEEILDFRYPERETAFNFTNINFEDLQKEGQFLLKELEKANNDQTIIISEELTSKNIITDFKEATAFAGDGFDDNLPLEDLRLFIDYFHENNCQEMKALFGKTINDIENKIKNEYKLQKEKIESEKITQKQEEKKHSLELSPIDKNIYDLTKIIKSDIFLAGINLVTNEEKNQKLTDLRLRHKKAPKKLGQSQRAVNFKEEIKELLNNQENKDLYNLINNHKISRKNNAKTEIRKIIDIIDKEYIKLHNEQAKSIKAQPTKAENRTKIPGEGDQAIPVSENINIKQTITAGII